MYSETLLEYAAPDPQQTLTDLYARYAPDSSEASSADDRTASLEGIAQGLRMAWALCEFDLVQFGIQKDNETERARVMERRPLDVMSLGFLASSGEAEDSYNTSRVKKARIKADIHAFTKACKAPGIKDIADPVLEKFPYLKNPGAPAPAAG